MRIKSKPQDFRVSEILREGYVVPRGRHRVYRVTKRKLTTLEAAAELAERAGVRASDVALAGLKDRQGVTTQFMSIAGGRPVVARLGWLTIETVGSAARELTSRESLGNAFEIVLRGVSARQLAEMRREAEVVAAHGLPNYYGEQRFGNLRHGQGWIAKLLALGRHEDALRSLLAEPSEGDHPRARAFKRSLASAWGEWKRCREIAGTFGAHHSVFEHLARDAEDFAGAFRYVKTEVRLIHLYAWQSHLWNRAVARWLTGALPTRERFLVPSIEGPLVFPRGAVPAPPEWSGTFRVPGQGLEDVTDPTQRECLALALRAEDMQPGEMNITGVPGFALKGEDRVLVVRPGGLRIEAGRTAGHVRLAFELPRGAYATLVVARLAPSRAPEVAVPEARRPSRAAQVEPRVARTGPRNPRRRGGGAARRNQD